VCPLSVGSRVPGEGTLCSAPGVLPTETGDELDPVAPRIAHVAATLTRDLGVAGPPQFNTGSSKRLRKLLERVGRADEQSRMRLQRRSEQVLDTNVQLPRSDPEPTSSANREQRRLLDLGQPEQLTVERPSRILAAGWRRNLNMVKCNNGRHRDGRPSYSGCGLAATTTNVRPAAPATTLRTASASMRR